MQNRMLAALTAVVLCGACAPRPEPSASSAADVSKVGKALGRVERLDETLDLLVPRDAELEVLVDGLDWPEGPVWIPGYDHLLFSDVPRNAIYRWSEADGLALWLRPSGYTGDRPRGGESGSNGLLLDAEGALVLCQHGDRRIARLEASWDRPQPRFATLVSEYGGRKFNSPNDAVYDRRGTLYFTDPPYGLEGGTESPDRELNFQGVYRLSPDGRLELFADHLTRPNGIALSPDERVLYVSNSDPERAIWMAYDLLPQGAASPGRVFFDATKWVGQRPGLPDGMAVDQEGNLFATGPGGVLVLSPFGMQLGLIETTVASSNCAFGDDGSSLYVTAEHYLLRIRLTTKGLHFVPSGGSRGEDFGG